MEKISYYPSNEQILDRGTRSVCYREGGDVFKVISGFRSKEKASKVLQDVSNDYETLRREFGDYVVPTIFEMSKNEKEFSIVLKQPYIFGVSIKRAFELSVEHSLNKSNLLDFLGRVVTMHQNTGQIPDVFGRPHIFGWYNTLTTPNVRVEITDNLLTPRLLDVGFARISKNLLTGSLHNRLLANNIRKTIEENA